MRIYAKAAGFIVLASVALSCSADAPLVPGAAELSDPAFTRAAAAGTWALPTSTGPTFKLEVGWTAPFEVGSRQYQRFVRYVSSNPTVASVSTTGVIRALAPGNAVVTGTLGTVSSQAQVEVIANAPPPEVESFGITPKFGAAIDLGATQKFSTLATWSDGVPRDVSVTYRATGGNVSSMGLFSAGQTAGVFTVIATCVCGMADTAFLRVGPVPAQLASLRISPKTVTLQPGVIHQFNSVATWNTGDTTPPPRTYSSTGGTITATGAYTAGSQAGTYRVIVAHSGGVLRDTAVVTVAVTSSNPGTPPLPPGTGNPFPTPPYSGSYGPGPNAPAWAEKRAYPEELFATPIPVHPASPNAAGFKLWHNHEGTQSKGTFPQRISFPTVSTPIGTKRVLQVTYPGSTTTINATGQSTRSWPINNEWSVRVTGAWTGTLLFEKSTDGGVTWDEVSLRGAFTPSVGVATSGARTDQNGTWAGDAPLTSDGGVFRVRAAAWVSGSATVAVGVRGGVAPPTSAGAFTGDPKRVYTRLLAYVSDNWSNGGNTATKFFFFSQVEGNNHYVEIVPEGSNTGFVRPRVLTQQAPGNVNRSGGLGPPIGQWVDLEWIFEAGDAGKANGVVKAWVNGVQLLDVNNIRLFASGKTPRFTGFNLHPTYGGGQSPPPDNIYFQIAAWYRESAP